MAPSNPTFAVCAIFWVFGGNFLGLCFASADPDARSVVVETYPLELAAASLR